MDKEQQELLDEAYDNYGESHWSPPEDPKGKSGLLAPQLWSLVPMEHSKESFIAECKTNPRFSKKWGLKIEERELTYKERWFLKFNETFEDWEDRNWKNGDLIIPRCSLEDEWTEQGIPSKLITITYKDKKIKSYE